MSISAVALLNIANLHRRRDRHTAVDADCQVHQVNQQTIAMAYAYPRLQYGPQEIKDSLRLLRLAKLAGPGRKPSRP